MLCEVGFGANIFSKDEFQSCEEWKILFFNCEWYEVYDFIEFFANDYSVDSIANDFIRSCDETAGLLKLLDNV